MSGWAVLLVAVGLVAISATALTFLLRPVGRIDGCVTWAVVAIVNVVGATLLLGVLGRLRPGPIVMVHAVGAVITGVLLLRRDWPRFHPRAPELRRALLRAPWESALVGIAALALGWQLFVGLVLPPYAYDALTYHLTNVATWAQSGRLMPTPLSLCCAYYPGNAELLWTWPVVLLGHDALVGTVQIAAAALGGVAVAGIGRSAGLDRRGGVAAGALFILTPAVLAQAPTAYVDVLQAALTLCGLHGLARFTARAQPLRLVVPALCAGLLSGTKGNGLLWALALALAAAVVVGSHLRRGRFTVSEAVRALAGGVGVCAVLGGSWYLRNAVHTGNPLYPFELRLGDWTVFDGHTRPADAIASQADRSARPWPLAVAASWASDFVPWRHGSYDYQQRSGGLGPLWSWLGILVIPFVFDLWRRGGAALAAVVPILAVFLVQPLQWWAPFTLPLAALGAIAAVVSVRRARSLVARSALQSATIGLSLLGAVLVIVEVNPASRAKPLPMSRVLELRSAAAQERSIGRLFFTEYRFLEEVPEQATVMVDLEAPQVRFIYPLFGSKLQREVLPSGPGPAPDFAWVVTARGRPLDIQLARSRPGPVSDQRGVRVWAPTG